MIASSLAAGGFNAWWLAMPSTTPLTTWLMGLSAEADVAAFARSPASMSAQSVRFVLRERRRAVPAGGVTETISIDGVEEVLRCLAKHDVPARSVQVGAPALPGLALPALAVLHSGALVPVLRVGRSVMLVADDGRPVRIPRAAFERRMTGVFVDLSPALDWDGGFGWRTLRLLWKHRSAIGRIAAISVLVMALALVGPWVSSQVMDRALPNDDRGLLGAIVAGMLCVGLHQSWFGWLRARTALALGTRVEAAIQTHLFESSLRLPFANAHAATVGSLLTVLAAGVDFARLCISAALVPLMDLLMAIGQLAALSWCLPWAGALALAAMLLCFVITVWLGQRLASLETASFRAAAANRSRLHEVLTGVVTLKALGAEMRGMRLWLPEMFEHRSIVIAQGKIGIWLRLWTELAQRSIHVGLIGFGGAACLDNQLSLGSFLFCASLASGFVSSASSLVQSLLPAFSVPPKLRLIDGLLDATPAAIARATAPSTRDAIVMEDVWFRYSDDGPWILQGYNLRLCAGESFVLHGPSGMGKTTILRLIAGLLSPTQGQVKVFGSNPVQLAGVTAYLPQEPLLLSGSILSNLRTLASVPDARISEAARMTGLDELAGSLPMRYETVLSAGGTNISGGQRQLILLTAAVASERPILLLDESLAHVDRVTRTALAQRELFQGKTVVSVVHDV
jgi:ATP-binding cassette, subfamily B, bacterial